MGRIDRMRDQPVPDRADGVYEVAESCHRETSPSRAIGPERTEFGLEEAIPNSKAFTAKTPSSRREHGEESRRASDQFSQTLRLYPCGLGVLAVRVPAFSIRGFVSTLVSLGKLFYSPVERDRSSLEDPGGLDDGLIVDVDRIRHVLRVASGHRHRRRAGPPPRHRPRTILSRSRPGRPSSSPGAGPAGHRCKGSAPAR